LLPTIKSQKKGIFTHFSGKALSYPKPFVTLRFRASYIVVALTR